MYKQTFYIHTYNRYNNLLIIGLFSQILGYICSIEAIILASLTKCYQQYRHVLDDYSDMCLEERELSPICSNDITNNLNNTNNNTSTDLPNHRNYNKIPTTGDTGTPTTPTTCNQKPYIPGESIVYNS